MEAPLRGSGHKWPVYRLRRLCDRLSPRCARVPRRRRHLSTFSARGIWRPRRLQPRRQRLHILHAACPRFRAWEPEIDDFLFGRARRADEVEGIFKDIVLARATDPDLHAAGQDGGLVSAILVYTLEHDVIDAALVSYLEGDGSTWKAVPGIARTRAEVLASAGSRYTYSANTLAYMDLEKGVDERVSCWWA